MKSNKALGNIFECQLSRILFEHGWWVHNTVQSNAGQPMDIIACKGVVSMLIDCKVCSNDTFDKNRIEPNQETSIALWNNRVNRLTFFAFKLSDGSVRIASYNDLALITKKVLNKADLESFESLDDWLNEVCIWS